MTMQKVTPAYLWAHSLCSEFIQGAATAFLVVAGGNTAGQMAADLPSLAPKTVLFMTGMGGLIGAATYLKQHPLPDFSAPAPASQ